MRRIIWALALAMSATRVGAQQPDTVAGRGALPQNIANEVMRRWEAAGGVRGSGPVTIEAGREVSGDVAVRGGTVTIGGRIQGHVTALDADVVLQPGARVDGDLWVIGGALSGREGARIDGEIRIYRERVEYRMDGDLIVVRGATRDEPRDSWWQRRRQTVNGSADALRIAHAGAYNRAEGLPIKLGPALQQRYPWGSVRIDASAVVRTASTFDDGHGDVGHDVGAEVRFGQVSGVGIGGQLFNTVAPVESWQMSNLESSLASFLFHRDYRDYYERHGGRGRKGR